MGINFDAIKLMAVIGVVLAVVGGIAACKVRSRALSSILLVLTVVFLIPAVFVVLALNPEIIDARFRTYKAFYREIDVGMTRQQVNALLDKHYPPAGPRQRPKVMDDTEKSLGFFMHPETSREPNCEGIFLKLENNRVTRKEYSPD